MAKHCVAIAQEKGVENTLETQQDPKKRLSADEVYTKLKELEDLAALAKYDEAQKLGRKRSSVKNGQQSVEVVGCQCVIS